MHGLCVIPLPPSSCLRYLIMDIRRALASLKHLCAFADHLCLQAIKLLVHYLSASQVRLDPL